MRILRLWRPAAARRLQIIIRRSIFIAFAIALVVSRTASAATLAGRVTDPDGRAIVGARIIVATTLGTVADRTTDTGGTFEIAGLAAGQYELRVIADGFSADPVAVNLAADDTREVAIQLRLSAVSESIIVSASQVDVPLSRAPDSVTVITAADLESRQIETVADALRLVPGLTITRSGGRGAITSLFPRGGASNYTLVLIDGVRANDFGGGFDFAHLSVADVDHIEIVRGAESALFGSDAIGAVVQIVTRRGGPPHVDAAVEGGGYGTERVTVSANGSNGEWSWGSGADQIKSDGYTGLATDGERVSNDDYHLWHVSGTLGWQRPTGPDFAISGNVGRDERGFPGPFGSDPTHAFGGVDRISRGIDDTHQIGARFTNPWSTAIRQRIDANYTDLSGHFTSRYGPSSSSTRRFDGRIQEDIAVSSSLGVSAGLEYMWEHGSSSYITDAAANLLPIERGVTGAFAELRSTSRDRLFVTGGVRVERITRNRLAGDPNGLPPRPAFLDQTIDSVNPKLAVSYLLTPPGRPGASTRLRASAGSGIRPPNAFEIAFTDNPNLKPERSRSAEGGIEQQFADGAYTLGATAFFNRYDDLIVTVGRNLRGASRYYSDNISNAQARGLEISGAARVIRGLTLRAN